MSEFAVSIERIDRVWHHPNADRLDLATLAGKGWQVVVGRGQTAHFEPNGLAASDGVRVAIL
jgi:hypothetical protein